MRTLKIKNKSLWASGSTPDCCPIFPGSTAAFLQVDCFLEVCGGLEVTWPEEAVLSGGTPEEKTRNKKA